MKRLSLWLLKWLNRQSQLSVDDLIEQLLTDQMCPNCVTPWKCNGPHIPKEAP